MRAASIAVLPPPTMPTTRPSDGARPCSTCSISVTALMILPPSMAGISRWFATWAPMPRNTASKLPAAFSASTSFTRVLRTIFTPIASMRAISFISPSRGSR